LEIHIFVFHLPLYFVYDVYCKVKSLAIAFS
jgi:hypothetical protein